VRSVRSNGLANSDAGLVQALRKLPALNKGDIAQGVHSAVLAVVELVHLQLEIVANEYSFR
jgi:hypothetical protein